MTAKHIEYRGFTKIYDKPVNKLSMPVNVLPIVSDDKTLCNIPVQIEALWDTGATLTAIKPELRDRLKLCMFRIDSPLSIDGVGGIVKADFTVLSIFLTNNLVVEYCPVYVVDLPVNFEMIIGMDIIKLGDFAVSNSEGKTSISFASPSFPDRIDLARKAEISNMRNAG
jgi:predicted aspartyl protease